MLRGSQRVPPPPPPEEQVSPTQFPSPGFGRRRNSDVRGRGGSRAGAQRTARPRGNCLTGTQGPEEVAAMLPSLQESLDGDEKELESSEEGGSAEERRLEPPPSSHYCLYSFRGSRCPRPARCARGPAARPCTPRPPLTISSPSQGLWPDGPSWPQSVLPGSSGLLCPALPSHCPLAAPVIVAPDICSSEFASFSPRYPRKTPTDFPGALLALELIL